MKIMEQNEAVFGGWFGGREGYYTSICSSLNPKAGRSYVCYLPVLLHFAVTTENVYFKNATLQAVFPQDQHMRYKNQLLLHMHSFHLSPKAFQGVSCVVDP